MWLCFHHCNEFLSIQFTMKTSKCVNVAIAWAFWISWMLWIAFFLSKLCLKTYFCYFKCGVTYFSSSKSNKKYFATNWPAGRLNSFHLLFVIIIVIVSLKLNPSDCCECVWVSFSIASALFTLKYCQRWHKIWETSTLDSLLLCVYFSLSSNGFR